MSETQRVKISLELDVSRARHYAAFDVCLGEGHHSLERVVLALLRSAEIQDLHNVSVEHPEDEAEAETALDRFFGKEPGVPF